jgi:hypothetical protein
MLRKTFLSEQAIASASDAELMELVEVLEAELTRRALAERVSTPAEN